jgi:hypothetical protein
MTVPPFRFEFYHGWFGGVCVAYLSVYYYSIGLVAWHLLGHVMGI